MSTENRERGIYTCIPLIVVVSEAAIVDVVVSVIDIDTDAE